MKSATIPSLRVDPELRLEAERVLHEEDKETVTILALRHQLEEDYH
ncbi:MAG: hypothetical protein ACYCZR_11260 [Burkholderiales bacterium]